MITKGSAFLVFGDVLIRSQMSPHYSRFSLLKFKASDQSIGFNSAVIASSGSPSTYYFIDEDFQITKHLSLPMSEMCDEFGLTQKLLDLFKLTPERMAPLFLIAKLNHKVYTYSLLLSNPGELVFVNTGNQTFSKNRLGLKDLGAQIHIAAKRHINQNYKLNNYNSLYTKINPDVESEYKLDLPQNTDIWNLQRYFIKALQTKKLKGYLHNPSKGITRWLFENYLFEITKPQKERGYISFIRNPNGTYIIKHKIYDKDKLHRIELRNRDIKIEGSLESYLKNNYPNLRFKKYPMFMREFYGFVMDSLDTGNNFGFTADRCYIPNTNYPALVQVEIEYYNSLNLKKPTNYKRELKIVTEMYEDNLKKLQIPYRRSFYSKLTYLKDYAISTLNS